MLIIESDAYYTIKDLTEGFYMSRSSVYEMMSRGLRYQRLGSKRVITGKDLIKYMNKDSDKESSA